MATQNEDPCTVINVYCGKEDPEHRCDCPFGSNAEFAEVFSVLPQDLTASPGLNLAGQVTLFDQAVHSTAGIDITQAAVNGKITINKAGWYDVVSGVSGSLNPLSAPLNCWSVSLFKNGVVVPGSTIANITISPEQKANEIPSDVFIHLMAGDVLELANTSTNVLHLTAPTLGTNAQTNSAYLKISMLKAD